MGRGEYYRNKYSRGRGRGTPKHQKYDNMGNTNDDKNNRSNLRPCSKKDLEDELIRLDKKSYGFYRDLYGKVFDYDGVFKMHFIYIQSDAYAAPSRLCVTLPLKQTRFPGSTWSTKTRSIALADYICRSIVDVISRVKADVRTAGGSWRDGKGGELRIEKPSQNILMRSSVEIKEENVLVRCCVGLPAQGRSICGPWAAEICCKVLNYVISRACVKESDESDVVKWVQCYEDQEHLRAQLLKQKLLAFVPEGAVLPRSAGNSDTPLIGNSVVKFTSPDSLKVILNAPNKGPITGMGIREGITVITGGGFHGKSTLLSAIKMGVYSKIPGDGREYIVSTPSATKIRAEDGRSIAGVDISCFIADLPQDRTTREFYTRDASGSTSQAAAIMEFIEIGGTCVLIDEDTAATNFMIRDHKMQLLLPSDKEPIKPYVYRARELFNRFSLSSILVVGSSGDYFDIADTVLMLDNYVTKDVTRQAKEITLAHAANVPTLPAIVPPRARYPDCSCFGAFLGKTKVVSWSTVNYGDHEEIKTLDLSAVEQIVEIGQTRFIVEIMKILSTEKTQNQNSSLIAILNNLEKDILSCGLGRVNDQSNWLSKPRIFEIFGAINRYRELKLVNQQAHISPLPNT